MLENAHVMLTFNFLFSEFIDDTVLLSCHSYDDNNNVFRHRQIKHIINCTWKDDGRIHLNYTQDGMMTGLVSVYQVQD
jgi:hypothetical protein